MEFKGTKGKWELTDNKRDIEVHIKPRIYKSICSSTGNTKWQYDMLLISKAPEMLEGLKEALKFAQMKNSDVMVEYFTKLIKEATEL